MLLLTELIDSSKPKLETFWKYAKVELAPPTPADIPKIQHGIADLIKAAKTGRWKQLTVRVSIIHF